MKKLYTLLFIITSYCSFSQGYYGTPATGVTVIHYSEPVEETEINEISTFDAPITPFGTPTGSSLEVGTIEGTLNVSLSGAATYDIPIALPPGIGGNAPKISLSYNSQGGNGYAGYGWNISGISSITKIPSTKYHDNVINVVDYDAAALDRLALDGNRLIKKSGLYSGDAVYETESFSNLKITSTGSSPYKRGDMKEYGPNYFKVEYPDGSYALYGSVTNSNSRNEWAITYWQNTEGIRISYEYIKDDANNSLRISKIKYGSRLETAALNEIEFIYTTRNRPEQAYIGEYAFSINTILSEIRVKGNNVGFRNYVLTYDITSLGYQRLTKITEKSGDNTKSYNPTVFTYTNTSDSMYYTSTPTTTIPGFSNIAITNSNTVTADFDGDGGMDFILYPTSGELKRKKYWVYTNLNAPSGPNIVEHQVDQFEALIPITFLAGDATTGYKLKADPGWVIIQNSGTTLYVSICSSPFTPGTGINVQYGFSISLSELGGNGAKSYCSGDFNGDGLTDVICVDLTTGKFYFIDLDKRLSNHVSEAGTLNTMGANDKLLVGDYDGDGKSDLLHFRNNSVRLWYHIGSGNSFSSYTLFTDDPEINPSLPIWLGDYNGDGKMDFIIPKAGPPYSTEYYKYTSGGGKTTEQFFHYEPGNAFNTHHYIPTDVNNDGKTDLAWITTTVADGTEGSPGSLRTRFLINKNGNFSMTTGNYITSSSGTVAGINTFSVPLFMNPDKLNPRMEVAVMGGNKIHYFKSTKDFSQEKLLTSITNGNGIIETITYKPLIKCKTLGCLSDYVTDELVENYPNFDVTADPGHYIVTKLERKSSAATTKQIYRYLGAVTNVEGLGFLGFKSIFKTNWHQDNSQITSSVINFDIEKRGAVKSEYTFESFGEFYAGSNPTIFLSKTLNTNVSEISPNKVFKIKNTVKETFNGLDNTRYRETTAFDEYNNITSSSFSFARIISGLTLVSKSGNTTFTYDNNPTGTTYYIGRPLNKSTSTTLSSGTLGQLTTEEIYSYTNNLLTQIKTKGHNTNYVTQDNIYDIYGNVTKRTVTATGLVPRVSNFQYDPTGRFLTKATDGEGLATTYVINANNGSTTSITDPYGNVTQYFYDVWGKNIKTTDYLGKNTVSTFAVLPSGMAEVTTTGDDGSSAYSRFDDLGREFITGVKNIDNTWSYIKKEYDIYDREVSRSEPYSDPAGTPSQFSTTLYDAIGRIKQTTDYTGKITNFTYSPLTSIVDDGTQTITTTLDAAGNMLSRKDSGGTVKYSYNSRNNLRETDYDGVKTLIEYNGWGQKTKLTDPSAGVYQYEYNDFGEITKETTPKGYTNYTYDNFGKIKGKLRNDGSTGWSVTYNYDATTKLLSSVDRLGSSMIYTYDAKKRIIDIEDQSPSATYKKTYTYDAFGRIDKETFATTYSGQTSSTIVRNTYKNGYHWQIYDDATNQMLTQVNTVNARGQLATAQLGNGADISNTYDTYGYNKRILHKKATTTLLDNNYVFNAPKGNLTSRNNIFGLSEAFQYDNLDRLTHYTNALGEQEQQIYNPNGKITSNPLGTYGYDSTKTYQQNILEMTELGKAYYQSREGLFDGTMEDKSGWSLTTLSSYATDKAKSGKYSLKVNLGTGQALPVTIQSNKKIPIDNTATTKYTISGWVFNANANSQSSLKLNMTTSGGTTTTTSSATNSAINSWVYLSQEIDVPATIKQLSISIGADGTGAIWYDDLKIRKTADITTERKLNITYNMFKAPDTIEETGVDKISFEYINSYESRSSMYYGSMNNDKMLRPYRKHYSADGTTEIKHNIVDNSIEFITYIGGDGYDAPVVFKKKGAVQEYLYLHRDYQGSIVAISNQAGTVLEKRAFDAWGNILNVQGTAGVALNGLTILDRGYTGHEHLQSVALINMNGRIYDPKLHRFLQPDNDIQNPYNTQNYNRYGYVLNNPLRYTDPSGENFLTWMSGGNCTTCGSEYGGGGGIDGLGSLFIGLGITAEKNWPAIKDFFTKNNFENPFKQSGKWIEKQAGGINDWLDKQLRSIGHSKKDYQKIVVSPQYGAAQSSGGWIKTGFQNVGLTGSVNNSGGGGPDPRPRFNLANFFKSLISWGRNPEEAERNNENRRIFYEATDKSIEVAGYFHEVGFEVATLPFGGPGKGMATRSIFTFTPTKILKQIPKRGWTVPAVHKLINKPFTTRAAVNRASGNAATAYFNKKGAYVVKDNLTNEVIQVSNKLDPNWIPDATIINPYIPK